MADIIISRKIQPYTGLSIAETMSVSSDVIETAIFNPAESMSLGLGIYDGNFSPTESMTYIN